MKTTIVSKLNVRSAAMLISLILSAAGVVMVYDRVRQEGKIDIKSPFVSGTIESGFVGVSLIFCAVAIALAALHSATSLKQETTVRVGDVTIRFHNVHPPDAELLARLAR